MPQTPRKSPLKPAETRAKTDDGRKARARQERSFGPDREEESSAGAEGPERKRSVAGKRLESSR